MGPISRREMLKRLGTAIGVATVLPLPAATRARAQAAIAETFISFTPAEAETLRAIVARLIPADENGPGALEARADRYIDRALSGALKSSRAAYTTGLAAVNAQAQSLKNAAFSRLSSADQDAVLTNIQQTAGTFFNLVRNHTIQGMFSDPFYGGNANFIGWDLIGYPGARTTVAANLQLLDRKPEPSRKSAYDYGMFSKGEI
ncbi:MAG TPA: gluconate 2-dehydrogenase subunit 3 family protein [Terriglobia bacterium]|nr:gluconate 2-dehydrogenase subunit 3 family protein [Terriglobia bacterium]